MMGKSLLMISMALALLGVVVSGAWAGEEFRSELLEFIRQMRVVAAESARQQGGPDQTAALDNVERMVRSLTPEQLATLEAAFALSPNWREIPGVLGGLLNRPRTQLQRDRVAERPSPTTRPVLGRVVTSRATDPWLIEPVALLDPVSPWGGPWKVQPAITPNDCATARAAGYTQTDVEIAADVALAADVILEAIPNDVLGAIARAIAVGLWAIPQGVLRGFEHLYNIASACDDEDHQTLVKDNLDVKVSTRATQTSVNGVQTTINTALTNVASVQTSVNGVQASVNAASTVLGLVQTTVNNVQTGVNTANTALTALQATAATIETGVAGANTKLDNALSSLTTAQTKLDSLLDLVSKLAPAEVLIRLHIETNLAQPLNNVALFALPAAQGGHLETARAIVVDVIQMTQASGQSVGLAPSLMAIGDQHLSRKNFRAAYEAYGKAYRLASQVLGGFGPGR